MDNYNQLLQQATQLHQQGQLDAAFEIYQQAAQHAPERSEALLYQGVIFCQKKEYESSIEFFTKAGNLGADDPVFHINYGLALMECDKLEQAEEHFSRGAELDPQAAEAFFNLGMCRLRQEKYEPAVEAFYKTLVINPNDGEGWINYGIALTHCGNGEKALEAYDRAYNSAGESARLRLHIAQAYEQLKDYPQAITNYKLCLEQSPNSLTAITGLARSCNLGKQTEQALNILAQTLNNHPEEVSVLCLYATTLVNCGRLSDALPYAEKALGIDENFADAHSIYAYIQFKLGNTSLAHKHYEKAIELNPQNPNNYLNHANSLIAQGRVEEALVASQQCLNLDPSNASAFSNVLLHMHYSSVASREDIFKLHQQWASVYAANYPQQAGEPIDTDGIIKLGILSGDLRRHSVAFFAEPVIAQLPRDKFELYIYSNNPSNDSITKELSEYQTTWRDIRNLTDTQAYELIKEDNIDVLLELNGHTDNNRLQLFAMRPAPVLATWLGYPDTTGLSGSVYRLSDNICDPQENHKFCTEHVVSMAGPFICYHPPKVEIEATASGNAGVVFGSFNALAKISDFTVALWSEILRRCEKSRLLLKSRGLDDQQTRDILLQRFEREDIDTGRIELLPMVSDYSEHMQSYNKIDIALDTFPYNGTTTTCEALYMNTPVITLLGASHCCRVGGSILLGSGFEENICQSEQEYIERVCALAGEFGEGATHKNNDIRQRFISSGLCNQDAFISRFSDAIMSIIGHYNNNYTSK